jgi:hypothetical protein
LVLDLTQQQSAHAGKSKQAKRAHTPRIDLESYTMGAEVIAATDGKCIAGAFYQRETSHLAAQGPVKKKWASHMKDMIVPGMRELDKAGLGEFVENSMVDSRFEDVLKLMPPDFKIREKQFKCGFVKHAPPPKDNTNEMLELATKLRTACPGVGLETYLTAYSSHQPWLVPKATKQPRKRQHSFKDEAEYNRSKKKIRASVGSSSREVGQDSDSRIGLVSSDDSASAAPSSSGADGDSTSVALPVPVDQKPWKIRPNLTLTPPSIQRPALQVPTQSTRGTTPLELRLSGLALAPGSNFKFARCCFGTGIGTGLCCKAIRELRVRALQLNKCWDRCKTASTSNCPGFNF